MQQAILQAGMRRPVSGQTTAAELLRISQSSAGNPGLAKLAVTRSSSPEELRAVAVNLGAQPTWENYHRDLLELPRGLMRSALDPEGLLSLRTFGTWEPMIDVS